MRSALSLFAAVTLMGNASSSQAEIQKLSDIIGAKISVENDEGLKVADLVIDQEAERVAYLTFTRFNAKKTVVVPAQDLSYENAKLTYHGKADALASAPATPKREQLHAKRMAKVDKHFGHDPYWKENKNTSGKSAEPRLRMGKSLLNIEVTDGKNEKLGEVVDAAIDLEHHKVPYVVIRDTKGQMPAVPLAAFEKSEDTNDLVLQVPQDVFFNGATFSADDAWPSNVDRQWIEYVQVRYGRKGVQAAGAAEENSTSQK